MIFKKGVKINGIKPEAVLACLVIVSVLTAQGFGAYDIVITSGTEGKHSRTSLHYVGFAVDVRSNEMDFPEDAVDALKIALTDEFDVIQEKTHIHVEFQPKK